MKYKNYVTTNNFPSNYYYNNTKIIPLIILTAKFIKIIFSVDRKSKYSMDL